MALFFCTIASLRCYLIDEGIIKLAGASNGAAAEDLINRTFTLLDRAAGRDALRRFESGHHTGKISLVGLEGIAIGVAKNLQDILALAAPQDFVRDRIRTFWIQPQAENFTSPGLLGTTRIQRMVSFSSPFAELLRDS